MTSLANIFTKALLKIILRRYIFTCEPISKNVAFFRIFGMQKDDKIIIGSECFRIRRYAKKVFLKDGVRRVDVLRNRHRHQ